MKKKSLSVKLTPEQNIRQPLIENVQTSQTQRIGFFQLFRFADRKDILFMIIGSIGGLGSGASLPIFSYIFANVTTVYQQPDSVHQALKSAIQFFILGGATFILNFIGVNMWIIAGERQSNRYRKHYYKLLLNQQVKWYDGINPNSISSQISNQITAIQEAIGQKISVLQSIFVTCVLGFFLAYFRNWRVSLVLTAIFPLLVLAGIISTKAVEVSQNKNRQTYSEAGAISQQAFSLIKNIKSLVGQDFQLQKFTTRLFQGKEEADKLNLFFSISNGIVIFLFVGTYSIAFWYGKVVLLYYDGDFNDIMASLLCVMIGGLSISPASGALKNMGEGVNAVKKIIQLERRIPTLIQKQDGEKVEKIDEIIFEDVTFNYKPDIQQRNILQKLNIKIPKNKVTAICGESGSGKSTIVQLIQRFYDPLSGRVLINGKDLKQLDIESYRKQIGYVGQEPSLFSFSIKENLLLAKQTATDEQIIAALKLSNAYEFVRKMEHGINTFVGAAGAQISGGQKQRIAIARAILKNPSLYIFDEATSALDRKNERLIQQTLKRISSNHTTLVIAHRLSTIQDADNIIVLNRGVVVEQGTHQELYNKKGYYFDLIKNQVQANQDSQQEQQFIIKKTKQSSSIGARTLTKFYDDQEFKIERAKKQDQVFYKIFNESKQSLIHYIFGSIHALINGLILPIFALIFSHLITLIYEIGVFYTHHVDRQITYYCLSFVGLALVGGITTFGYNLSFSKIGQKIIYRLRIRLFNKLLRQQIQFYEEQENNPGALSAKLAKDAYIVKNFTSNIIGISILNFSIALTGIILSLAFDWAVALIVLGLCPIILIAAIFNLKKMKVISTKSEQSYRQAGNLISDTVCNIRTTKSFGSKSTLQKLFNDSLIEPSRIAKEKAFTSGIFQAISQSAILFIYGLVFYLAAVINIQQKKDPLNIFISVFSIIFAAYGVSNNARFITDIAKSKNAAVNIFDIIQSKDEYERFVQEGGIQKPKVHGDIQFKNVTFKYPSRKKKVFTNLNFKIVKNTKVAFVGISGCGKSTIFQLLMRFYEIQSGKILIDGKDIKSYDLYHLRTQYGLVSQQPPLFIGNIEQNVKYKNINKMFSEVVAVTKIANAHQFIQTLSQQMYQKQVGSKGGQLSGGQKQRIAIARCLLANPNIFMFDQSTSALDLETQKIVFQNLKIATHGKTTLSIAHRISTIVDADMILVFDNGKIIQSGTYNDLTSAKGYFYRLERGQN